MKNLSKILLMFLALGIVGLMPLLAAMSVATCIVFNLPMWLSAVLLFVLFLINSMGLFAWTVKVEEWLSK